jgi:colicin import membrane protein
VGFHVICALLIVLGLSWTRTARPLSVAGPIIEASLVNYTAKPLPAPRVAREKPAPPRAVPPPPPSTPQLTRPELPPSKPRATDTVDRERVDRDALEPSEIAQREQEERRKRDQELLEEDEQISKMERERLQQLEDIRKLREQAEQRRKVEQQRLAQLEDRERKQLADEQRELERQRAAELLESERDEQRAGNEGVNEDLLSRYQFALQSAVTINWLRPETALPGLRCKVHIVQIPPGDVISANVIAPCNTDEQTKRSLEAAVLRAAPLPYQGFESVFKREITFVFTYDG